MCFVDHTSGISMVYDGRGVVMMFSKIVNFYGDFFDIMKGALLLNMTFL